MRQPSYSSPRRWIALAVQKLTARRVVETLPTLEVSPVAAPVSRRVVETPSSRFAPAEETLPPVATETPVPTSVASSMVTAVPAFAKPAAARRSTRPAGSPEPGLVTASVTTGSVATGSVATGSGASVNMAASGAVPRDSGSAAALPDESTSDPAIDETTGTAHSPRQGSRSRSSRQSGPVKVTVGDYSAGREHSASVSRERIARESYALKSRELERAADERLAYEQQLVERRIREQLEARQRELDSTLDEILEDTVILPRSIENR